MTPPLKRWSDPMPCAFCDIPDAEDFEIAKDGTVWSICQRPQSDDDDDSHCHWTDQGNVEDFEGNCSPGIR